MRLVNNILRRNLHNSLTKSTAPLDVKTEYTHFLISSTNCLLICGGLYYMEKHKANLKKIEDTNQELLDRLKKL